MLCHMVKWCALLPYRIQRNLCIPAVKAVLKFGTFHNPEIKVRLANLTAWWVCKINKEKLRCVFIDIPNVQFQQRDNYIRSVKLLPDGRTLIVGGMFLCLNWSILCRKYAVHVTNANFLFVNRRSIESVDLGFDKFNTTHQSRTDIISTSMLCACDQSRFKSMLFVLQWWSHCRLGSAQSGVGSTIPRSHRWCIMHWYQPGW